MFVYMQNRKIYTIKLYGLEKAPAANCVLNKQIPILLWIYSNERLSLCCGAHHHYHVSSPIYKYSAICIYGSDVLHSQQQFTKTRVYAVRERVYVSLTHVFGFTFCF